MADIFISYAREDEPAARLLADRLREEGWSVWADWEILAGSTYDVAIEEALRAARSVLVVWSSHAVGSRWVRNEAAEGLNRGILVPVAVEPLDAFTIPIAYRLEETAELAGWDGNPSAPAFNRLRRAVRDRLGEPVGPPPTEGWRAESTEATGLRRSLRLLGETSHTLEYRYRTFRPDQVKLDGAPVAGSWSGTLERRFLLSPPGGFGARGIEMFVKLQMRAWYWTLVLSAGVVCGVIALVQPLTAFIVVAAATFLVAMPLSARGIRIRRFAVAIDGDVVYREGRLS